MLVIALLLSLNGCMNVKSQSDVVGEYRLGVGANEITLKIFPDRRFSEKIVTQNGKIEDHSGKWSWANDNISFDQLWIPREFAPPYILRADSSAGANNQPKYTEPGHWVVSPEWHWGTVILPVFPDADTNFKMISHGSR